MKTEVISSEKITKEMAIRELRNTFLTQEEIDEYLDILNAINDGKAVFNLVTNIGEYLLIIDGNAIKDTRKKVKNLQT